MNRMDKLVNTAAFVVRYNAANTWYHFKYGQWMLPHVFPNNEFPNRSKILICRMFTQENTP